MVRNNYLVSAIVSVYNCERFIAGCLEDLERQTIADKLEIVVVNSGSQQNEEEIIKQFQGKYGNIVYIKTENRETIYQAWNRGIKAASGKYITNANSDDRLRKNALEIMANELEKDKNIVLVYADDIVTEIENETFEKHTPAGYFNRHEFSRHQLAYNLYIGPHPMWRKNIHEEFGYFDENLEVAGDYEFWLRISEKYNFKHIKQYLGLYLRIPNSAGQRNPEVKTSETIRIGNQYIISAVHNKKLLKGIRKRQSGELYILGCYHLKRELFSSAKEAFLHSIIYDWRNFISYKGLMACYFPIKIIEILRRVDRISKSI